jgi:hypothetical protein
MAQSRLAGRLPTTVGFAGSLLIGSMVAAEAGTIFSENFSGATEGSYGTGNLGGTQFKVTTGDVDVVGPANFTCVADAAIKCVDMIGSSGHGAMETTFGLALHKDSTYTISFTDILQGFALGGPQTLAYTVALGSHSFNATSTPNVVLQSFSFTATADEIGAVLAFATIGNIDNVHGPVLSGISVAEAAVATTPIPGALPLFASALGGFGFLNWRRRRSA